MASSYTWPGDGPEPCEFFFHNDLLVGMFQPLYGRNDYFSGYVEELRFWSRAISEDEMTDAIYRVFAPSPTVLSGIDMVGYWPMNAVKCTEELCGQVTAFQQWIHVSGSLATDFTSALVLYASPRATSATDCRSQLNSALETGCTCDEFAADYCWNTAENRAQYCADCIGCTQVQCYGPFASPKCLTVSIPGSIQSMDLSETYDLQIQACINDYDLQRFTKSGKNVWGRLQIAASALFCVASVTVEPFRGSVPIIEACVFQQGTDAPIPSQAWMVDPTGLKVRNQLTNMCLTAASLDSGSAPYLVDCISIDLFDTDLLVQSFLFDWANGRNGIVIGGAFLTASSKCGGKSLCETSAKAPIDQPPKIESINGEPLTQFTISMLAYVNIPFVLTMTARDPNRADPLQFDFLPYDEQLKTDDTVQWPDAYICRGGSQDGESCTCDNFACTQSGVCPGGGVCALNPNNGCPSNPCTRTFTWTPAQYAEFLNPSTLVFIASDFPINELLGEPAAAQSDFPLRVVVTVRMPPQFEVPTPRYVCEGGTLAGVTYRARTPCTLTCEDEAGGTCREARLTVEIGSCVSFTVRASNREPGSTISVKFLTEGPDVVSPAPSRVVIGPDEPTVVLESDGDALKEVLVMNPVTRRWSFCPNTVDARRIYQACFVAYNPLVGYTPESMTEVHCVEVEVLATNPLFDNPSPANGSTIEGYVGCSVSFHMAALKNDTAIYDLLVSHSDTFFHTFNGTSVRVDGLPKGAVFYELGSSDVTLTYSFRWSPEEGQEGTWEVCFATSDSFFVTTERRCVLLEIVRCLRCVRPGESLELIGQMYNTHWLELYAINPAVHSNPSMLAPGMLINVGILYRTPKLQNLPSLAKYLHTSPSSIRRLNPDILDDEEQIRAFARVCVLPEVCGTDCGDAAYCSRSPLFGEAPAIA
eukprot:CAMPEP_0181300342 /NCGR_PEP_ID=MMETSP1101-20121128/6837_1 /TAXON_ID=46948 /ORGANISM="Rhodomonas abbreviata, Strain Caron Lab Isolate" /LENGTH=927 /DNA_ID=CAMNT_0023405569 /DNA_START=879 /DNA_END=3662 /DNA_ORIENTATION=-